MNSTLDMQMLLTREATFLSIWKRNQQTPFTNYVYAANYNTGLRQDFDIIYKDQVINRVSNVW